jgi:transposase InsO family protein
MREDNLLSLRRKKYVFTTDSAHTLPIYPNLARHVKLTGLNQLWVADITFIRLRNEFIYLAVVLDAYSRRVIGWDLARTLQAELAVRALEMALSQRSWKAEGLIHHTDRGVQYASTDYTDLLEQNEIQISMSRRGNPYDNARAERFMRTLKEEEVHGANYRDLEDARSRIGEFLDQVYNRQRLHSALRYLTPEEFEQASQARGIDIGMRSLAFPVTPPCVRVRTRRFVRIKRRKCNATEEAPSFRNKWLAWHRREPVFG